MRCAQSYDILRLKVSLPGCTLVASHDDASVLDEMPAGAAAIMQLRRPVDRVVSAYQYAIGVAETKLPSPGEDAPADTSALHDRSGESALADAVWPWSHLVPWFATDMRGRLKAVEATAEASGLPRWQAAKTPNGETYFSHPQVEESRMELPDPAPTLDPYDNQLVMPLHEFVEHPLAAELIHNGATLQLLGLTNSSRWSQPALLLRACLHDDPATQRRLMEMAKRRLRRLAHVGLTEQLEDPIISLAAYLGEFNAARFPFQPAASPLASPLTHFAVVCCRNQARLASIPDP
jgi:hypothetical protein